MGPKFGEVIVPAEVLRLVEYANLGRDGLPPPGAITSQSHGGLRMPRLAYRSPALMAERTVSHWMRGSHSASPASPRELALRQRLDNDLCVKLEDVCGDHLLEQLNRTLLFVGTLLEQHGQHELWTSIYHVATDDPADGAETAFIEKMTAAARTGQI
jgi:hypothetical protein